MKTNSTANWVLRSKLIPPSAPECEVERLPILEKVFNARKHQVILVNAPAGYGKTTTLTQAYQHLTALRERVAWLTLDAIDRDLRQIMVYLAAALHQAGLPLGHVADLITNDMNKKATQYFCSMIFNTILDQKENYYLILDDYHEIECSRVNDFFNHFLKSAPDNFKIIISSRIRPSLSLARFFVRGKLCDISAKDLRFSHEEAAKYFSGRLNEANLSALIDAVEGWPAALRLFDLSITNYDRVAFLAQDLSKSKVECAEYFSEQIFLNMPVASQEFLLISSVPEKISVDLMNFLTGRNDAWKIIQDLDRRNLLISAIDGDRHFFRYHKLFKDFLYDRLNKKDAALVIELHKKLSGWYERESLLPEAVFHALRTKSPQHALELIERNGGWRIAVRGESAVFTQISDLSPQIFEPFVRTRLGQIYIMLQSSELAAAASAHSELCHYANETDRILSDQELMTEISLIEYIMGVYEDRIFTINEIRSIEERLSSLLSSDDTLYILVGILFCYTFYSAGDYARVIRNGITLQSRLKRHEAAYLKNYVYMYLGLSNFALGRLDEAKYYYQEILGDQPYRSRNFSGQSAAARIFLSAIFLEIGNYEQASQFLEQSLPVLEHYSGWFDLYEIAYDTMASLASKRGDLATALTFFQNKDLERIIVGNDRLHTLLGLISARELLHSGSIDDAGKLLQRADISGLLSEADEETFANLRLRIMGLTTYIKYDILVGNYNSALANYSMFNILTARSTHKKITITGDILAAAIFLGVGEYDRAIDLLSKAKSDSEKTNLWNCSEKNTELVVHVLRAESKIPSYILKKFEELVQNLPININLNLKEKRNFGLEATLLSSIHVSITAREREIVDLISSGCTSKEIANALGMSVNTVLWHRKNLYKKLHVSTRSQLIKRVKSEAAA